MIRPRPFQARALLVKVGRSVRAHRRAKGLTQRELSEQARINKKHIGALENGVKNPTIITLAKIANVLDCTLVALIERR